MTYYPGRLIQQCYGLSRPLMERPTLEDFLYTYFHSYYTIRPCSESTASRLLTRSRPFTRKFFRCYCDYSPKIPHCPGQLLYDLNSWLVCFVKTESSRHTLLDTLFEYVSTVPSDDAFLLLETVPQDPVCQTTEFAILLTRVVWYALCTT